MPSFLNIKVNKVFISFSIVFLYVLNWQRKYKLVQEKVNEKRFQLLNGMHDILETKCIKNTSQGSKNSLKPRFVFFNT